ncbi:WAT1-related protein At1g09380-like isoform X2 [Nymphaea colorata]|uniref:WAT1-related protein At1g09380-like isoform X2 n=1 Tax=Nymphaea colorata TaxID=210225 RepID=UPI00129ED3EE|nr:WAT1-related protein At1g09380-like isoform X2 [Nymphaea colorata]
MSKMESFMPSLAMILTQLGFAGLNVVSKVAMNKGMNPFVMVTYRQVVATLSTAPMAYFMERMETIGVRSKAGLAKVVGTVICVGGAMLMTFYKGPHINMWSSGIRWDIDYETSSKETTTTDNNRPTDFIIGSVMVVASCFAWAIWFILQARMSRTFSAPYTSTSMLCFVAAVQCGLMTVCMERNPSAWALGWNVRLLAVVYTGLVGSGMAFCVMSWCIQRRGPLFVSMFSPLLLIIVAFFGWALFDEKLHLGSVMGSLLIVVGLYGVLWGKGKEMEQAVGLLKTASDDVDDQAETAIEMGSSIAEKVGDNTMISKSDTTHSVDHCSKICVGEK